MITLPHQRRAEEFARLLDTAVRHPAGPSFAPLLAVAGRLQALPLAVPPTVDPALRRRLVAVATVAGAAAGRPAVQGRATPAPVARLRAWVDTRQVRRRLTVAVAGAAMALAALGVAVSASRSLPGDPFYGVKIAAEDAQLFFAHGNLAKGERHLEFARTRMAEIKALLAGAEAVGPVPAGQPSAAGLAFGGSLADRLGGAFRNMNDNTRAGTVDLTQAFEQTRSTRALRDLVLFAIAQYRDLQAVLPLLPTADRPLADSSLALVRAVDQRAVLLYEYGTCRSDCQPVDGALVGGTADALGPLPAAGPTGSTTGAPGGNGAAGGARGPSGGAGGGLPPPPPGLVAPSGGGSGGPTGSTSPSGPLASLLPTTGSPVLPSVAPSTAPTWLPSSLLPTVLPTTPLPTHSVIPSQLPTSVSPPEVPVPSLVGLSQAAALKLLGSSGLTYTIEQAASSAPLLQVISQSPAPGTDVAKGTRVAVTVSTGPVGGL